jgi:hypothetical protein
MASNSGFETGKIYFRYTFLSAQPNAVHSMEWVDYKVSCVRSVCRLLFVCLRYCVVNSEPILTKLDTEVQTTKCENKFVCGGHELGLA